VTLHLERLWTRDLTITTGLVDTYSTPTLLRLLAKHQIDAHRAVLAVGRRRRGCYQDRRHPSVVR
jgi:hypothetical protein